MSRGELEQQIRANYERDERMMILVFAQWCVNHDLDPIELYRKAYPNQDFNAELQDAFGLTVPKDEAGPIDNDTVLGVLSLFGNDELGQVVAQEIERLKIN
jgi:hypothetical protein